MESFAATESFPESQRYLLLLLLDVVWFVVFLIISSWSSQLTILFCVIDGGTVRSNNSDWFKLDTEYEEVIGRCKLIGNFWCCCSWWWWWWVGTFEKCCCWCCSILKSSISIERNELVIKCESVHEKKDVVSSCDIDDNENGNTGGDVVGDNDGTRNDDDDDGIHVILLVGNILDMLFIIFIGRYKHSSSKIENDWSTVSAVDLATNKGFWCCDGSGGGCGSAGDGIGVNDSSGVVGQELCISHVNDDNPSGSVIWLETKNI